MAARAWPGAATGSKWPLEPAPEPQLARNGRSGSPRSRRWLEMAARARPGAAEYLKSADRVCPEPQNARRVPLESASEPQNARRVPLEPPRRRKMFDGSRSSLPWSRSRLKCRYLLQMAARAWPGAADGSKWLLEPAPEPQMARNGRSSPPRSRRKLEKCQSSLPRSRRMLDQSLGLARRIS